MNEKYSTLIEKCKTCVELKSHPKMDGDYKSWYYGCTHPWNVDCQYYREGLNPLTYYEKQRD